MNSEKNGFSKFTPIDSEKEMRVNLLVFVLGIEHLSVMSLPLDGAITQVRAVELCIDIPIGKS